MATFNVSNTAGLMSALNSARGGDTILLKAGSYGHVDLNGRINQKLKFNGEVTIASADARNPAVIDRLSVIHAANLTFEDITFDYSARSGSSKPFNLSKSSNITFRDSAFDGLLSGGYGSGQGIWLTDMTNVTLDGNTFDDFWTAGHFRSIKGLTITDNAFRDSALDAMILGRVENVRIEGNLIDHRAIPGVKHKDAIQFWNTDVNAPSKNIVIRGNDIRTDDGMTHGIFFGNLVANQTGRKDAFYENVLIEDNTVVTGQAMGIAIAQTLGLTIRDNTVLQNPAMKTSQATNVPVIRVEEDAERVSITGNVTHRTPEPATINWQPTGRPEPDWTISGNKVVPLGTSAGAPPKMAAPAPDAPPKAPLAPAPDVAPKPPAAPDSDGGEADTFRFDGDRAGRAVTLDFAEGDRAVLIRYDNGTFDHIRGGNDLRVNLEGTYALLDSAADILELDRASDAVSLRKSGADLAMRITQDWGTQQIVFRDMADLL